MTRPFLPEDHDRRFKLAGTSDRAWGLLEFPITDRGSLHAPEASAYGILWFVHNERYWQDRADGRPGWQYVRPAEVEPVRPWHDGPAVDAMLHRATASEEES